MKFVDVEKRKSPMKMNLIALVFVVIAITGVFMTVNQPKKAEKERTERLQEIAADTTIKNIDVTYKPSDPGKFSKEKSMARTSQYTQSFYKTMITVTILFVLFFLVVYILKKRTNLNLSAGDNIKIIERKYLGQKQSLITVQVENEKLLLGVTDHSINLIKILGNSTGETEDKNDSIEDEADSFPKILGKLRNTTNEN
eukprot:Anaeramoba_ignava/a217287_100.p3 GENE.a217287_100~~a217287_100.p3  ORF type:complete len:198 (-),score=24.85 a217287_100:9-602(-)